MARLVSVIIPCFNAEMWLAEAINSCLNQTYSEIEIIVIDDGSSDRSLEVIKQYGDRVIWESDVNRGGNYARNRGFALSQGEYIQFLDADDYLLPEKIARQVEYLEETKADVVYGDWRHQYHHDDGSISLGLVKISDAQDDLLASLLSTWWVSPACLMFTRAVVEATGGWDESLKAGQDKDFLLSVVLSGSRVSYHAGCYSIYRRYGNVTVSTSSKSRYLESHQKILEKFERRLAEQEKLSTKYRDALAQSYFMLARGYLETDPLKYSSFLKKTLDLSPKFQANNADRTALYNLSQKLFGFRRFEKLVFLIKRAKAAGLLRRTSYGH
jgi:glycosyltransferase involved in cell wall biosynthesis